MRRSINFLILFFPVLVFGQAEITINGSPADTVSTLVSDSILVYTVNDIVVGYDTISTAGTGSVSGSGTDGYLTNWNGTSSIEDSPAFTDGTNIGLGTASPAKKFHISEPGINQFRLGWDASNYTDFHTTNGGYLNIDASGNRVYFASGNDVYVQGAKIFNALGSVGAPSYSFGGDINTGLWSAGADIINFSTAATERMRIDATGNVGIGITTPSEKLEVNGNLKFTPASGTLTRIWGDTGDGVGKHETVASVISGAGGVTGSGTDGYLTNWNGTTALEDSPVFTNGTNVGIGTSAPASLLEVEVEGAGAGQVSGITVDGGNGTGDGGSKIDFFYNGGAKWSIFQRNADIPAHSLHFSTSSGSSSGSKMTLTESGDLGVGTISPAEKLEVNGNLKFAPASGTLTRIWGDTGDGVGKHETVASVISGAGGVTGSGTDGYLPNWNGTTALEDSPVFTDGTNVGIGTASPNTVLHIKSETVPQFKLEFDAIRYITMSNQGYFNVQQGGSAENHFRFSLDGSEKMRLDDLGNLGIGTTSPTTILNTKLASGQLAGYQQETNDFNGTNTGSSFGMSFGATSGNTYSELRALSVGGSAWNNLVLQKSGGNVGIGDASPSEKLDINGNLKFTPASGTLTRLWGDTGDGAGKHETVASVISGAGGVTGSGTDGYLPNWNGTTALEGSPVFTDGTNIGIGTTAPTAPIHIIETDTLQDNAISVTKTKDIIDDSAGGAYAVNLRSNLNGTGSHTNAIGFVSMVDVASTGAGNVVRGVVGRVHSSGAGNIRDAALYSTIFEGNGTGTITNLFGLKVGGGVPSSFANPAATVTNTYGVHVGDITTGTQTNTPYSYYASDADALNYFAGNVGINVTGPTEKLHVNGNIVTNDLLGGRSVLTSGSATVPSYTFASDENLGIYRPLADNMAIATAGVERVRINATGNMGIGTTNPTELLEVNGNLKFTPASGTLTRIWGDTGDGVGKHETVASVLSGAGGVTGSGTDGCLTNWNGTTALEDSPVFTDGTSIGIGTASPTTILNTKLPSGQPAGYLQETNDFNGTNTGSSFGMSFGAASGNTFTELRALSVGGSAWNNLVLQKEGGNVGIGDASPSEKLDITGNLQLSGVLKCPAGSTVSPSIIFNGDLNNGIWSPANDMVAVSTGGFERFRIDNGGFVGIGTSAPGQVLEVNGNIKFAPTSATPTRLWGDTGDGVGKYIAVDGFVNADTLPVKLYPVKRGDAITQSSGFDFDGDGFLVPGYLDGATCYMDYAILNSTATTGTLTIGMRRIGPDNSNGSSNLAAATFSGSSGDVRKSSTGSFTMSEGEFYYIEVGASAGTLDGTNQGLTATMKITAN